MRFLNANCYLTLKMVLFRFLFCFPFTISRLDLGLIIFQDIYERHSQMMSNCLITSLRISWKSKEMKYEAIIHELHLASI